MDAQMSSHRLFIRGSFIKKVTPGIFSYGFLLLRSIRKFEDILRQELSSVGCQEILMPMVQPGELWKKSGRWPEMGELLKFKNKNNHDFCLGATHEEVISDFVQKDIQSYRDLPIHFYQIQTKYRDEIRPRFGLIRGREFIMKDAYSFDMDKDSALKSYESMKKVYRSIFDTLGVEYREVQASSGAIGGNLSSEFQVLAQEGMDSLLTCPSCGYGANAEVTPVIDPTQTTPDWTTDTMEKFPTPGLRTIDELAHFLKVHPSQLAKTFFVKYKNSEGRWEFCTLLLPGDREVNPVKVQSALQAVGEVDPLTPGEVLKATGAEPGSCGPVGLSMTTVMDPLLCSLNSLIVGANKNDFHLKNVVPHRDFPVEKEVDISLARSADPCPQCSHPLQIEKGIEVGHVFYLGQKYSQSMGLQYSDHNGKLKYVEMGCYGVGVTRSLQAVIEQSHDGEGMVWPKSVAPFQVHVCLLDPENEKLTTQLQKWTQEWEDQGLDVFIDDRNERPGIKFKDADLLGFPLRVTLGQRGVDKSEVEVTLRKTKEKLIFPPEDLSKGVLQAIQGVF